MWDFIAIAVVSGCLLEAYRAYTKSGRSNNAEVEALEGRVAALETRTRALETIVSDSNYQLGQDIESLKS